MLLISVLPSPWDSSACLHAYTKLLLCAQVYKAICHMKPMGRSSLPLLLSKNSVSTSSAYLRPTTTFLVNEISKSNAAECPDMPEQQLLAGVKLAENCDFWIKSCICLRKAQREMLTV